MSLETLIFVSLSLIIILFSIVLFNLCFLSDNFNKTLTYYLIKIIKFNKKTSNIFIFSIFIILFISLGCEGYFITELHNNLDKFIYFHINR